MILAHYSELANLREQLAKDSVIVFTNGVFDILHAGHVGYLQQAARLGTVLVVGVNSDASVQRLKGDGRPVNTLADRLAVLDALRCVDVVVPFEADTPIDVIQALLPDVLVKGADYTRDSVVGADVVEANGGRVELMPLLEGRSTTSIITRAKKV